MKILSKVEREAHDLIAMEYDDKSICELKRMANGDWFNASGAFLVPTTGLERLFYDWNNPKVRDDYRDKIILEVALEMVNETDLKMFEIKLKKIVDAIMAVRNK